MRWFRRVYGSHPLHLLALLGCFALSGYVALQLVDAPNLLRMLVWFAGAVIAHDLVLFPLYALADRSLTGARRVLRPGGRSGVPALNYIRVPALGAALTFIVFVPGIIQHNEPAVRAITGLGQDPYLQRWLLLSGAMFVLSAVVYALRAGLAARNR